MLDDEDPRLLPLIETLQELPEFDWMPNPGNWGDSLIRQGAEDLFARLGLRYRRIHRVGSGSTFVYGGGGSWCRFFGRGATTVAGASRSYARVIVLPSTYETDPGMPSNVTLFARDAVSQKVAGCRHPAVPDLAYLLKGESSDKTFRRLVAWRTNADRHSDRPPLPPENVDISVAGNHDAPVPPFLRFVGSFEEVDTDRMHVAIAASIQGCRLLLRDNGYHKIEAAYATFPDLFPNTIRAPWRSR